MVNGTQLGGGPDDWQGGEAGLDAASVAVDRDLRQKQKQTPQEQRLHQKLQALHRLQKTWKYKPRGRGRQGRGLQQDLPAEGTEDDPGQWPGSYGILWIAGEEALTLQV